MTKIFSVWICLTLTLGMLSTNIQAQVTDTIKNTPADTLKKFEDPITAPDTKAPFFKTKIVRAVAVPAILIGYGLTTIKDNGLYSSYDAKRDIQRHFPNFHTSLDDPLLIAPYVELVIVNLLNIKSNHDFLNTTLLILKAEAINTIVVYGLKNVTNQLRPNGENRYSLPSGHTAQAFLAASMLHNELRHKSQWYGVGAYAIATSVGVMRMLNNKHWQSDVFVGAGIGILSSHVAYLTHRNRWGRKPALVFTPTYIYGTPGVGLSINLNEIHNRKQLSSNYYPEKTAAPTYR